MKIFLSISLPISLILFNLYLYFYTEKKISLYSKIPPFRIEDFTFSKKSKLLDLKDGDPKTVWLKEQESRYQKYDAELEYTLTHEYSNGNYIPKKINTLSVRICEDETTKPEKIQIDLFLREAINIDKALRLPDNFFVQSFDFQFGESLVEKKTFQLGPDLKITKQFPEGIFIYTIFLKTFPEQKRICIADVWFD